MRAGRHSSIWSRQPADPHQGVDGATLVHRGVGLGDVFEVSGQVEDLARVDVTVENRLEQLRLVVASGRGSTARSDVAEERNIGVDGRVVRDADAADDGPGLGDGEGGVRCHFAANPFQDGVGGEVDARLAPCLGGDLFPCRDRHAFRHHAGVGVGTAYRRFANKEEVIDALFEEGLQDIAAVAYQALDEPDAWQGLVRFLERSLHMQFGDRGLNQVMNNPALGHARVGEARTRIAPLITRLVERAKKQGSVRPDFDQSDIIFVQVALSAIMARSRAIEPDLYRRYLAIFLDGIRTDRRTFTPLPVPAVSADQTHAAMTRRRRDDAGFTAQAGS